MRYRLILRGSVKGGNVYMTKRKSIGILIGTVVGAFFGSGMGIAAFGGAIAGTIPLAAIGGYIGFRLTNTKNTASGKS